MYFLHGASIGSVECWDGSFGSGGVVGLSIPVQCMCTQEARDADLETGYIAR